jgi:hypothetical protein
MELKLKDDANQSTALSTQTVKPQGINGDAMRTKAKAMARQADDAEFIAALDYVANLRGETQKQPRVILAELKRIFGPMLDGVPRMDSKEGDGNEAFNEYTYHVTVDGERKAKKGTWLADFYETLPQASIYYLRKELIAECNAGNAKPNYSDKALQVHADEIYSMIPEQRVAEKNKISNRITAERNAIRDAINLFYVWHDIENMPEVMIDWLYVDKNAPVDKRVIRDTPKPVKVWSKSDIDNFEYYSIATLITLDPAKAMKAGGSMDNLKATIGRGRKGGDGTKTSKFKIETVSDLEDAIIGIAQFKEVLDSMKNGKGMTALFNQLNKAESDDFLRSCFDASFFLDIITSKPEYASRVKALEQAERDAAKREAKEQAA